MPPTPQPGPGPGTATAVTATADVEVALLVELLGQLLDALISVRDDTLTPP